MSAWLIEYGEGTTLCVNWVCSVLRLPPKASHCQSGRHWTAYHIALLIEAPFTRTTCWFTRLGPFRSLPYAGFVPGRSPIGRCRLLSNRPRKLGWGVCRGEHPTSPIGIAPSWMRQGVRGSSAGSRYWRRLSPRPLTNWTRRFSWIMPVGWVGQRRCGGWVRSPAPWHWNHSRVSSYPSGPSQRISISNPEPVNPQFGGIADGACAGKDLLMNCWP